MFKNKITVGLFVYFFVYFFVFSFFFFISAEAKIEIVPLLDLKVGGGNSYFEEESSSFGGNFSLDLVPAIRFGRTTTLLPRYSAYYSGYRLAMEIEDEESLYQQSFDHTLSLKLIQEIFPDFKFRAECGQDTELLKESKDESWGDGLYDYDSPYTNFELEKKFPIGNGSSFLLGGGMRFYNITYPNYQSLASEIGLELMGKNVLDNKSADVFINGEIFWNSKYFTHWKFTHTRSDYDDQKIITSSAEYSDEKRNDRINNFAIGLNFNPDRKYYLGFEEDGYYKIYSGIDLVFKKKTSNQNHFDTEFLMFIPHFYSYNQVKLIPSVTFKFIPGNTNITLGCNFSYKNYPDRLAQNALGQYTDDELRSQSNSIMLNLSSPINERIYMDLGCSYKKTSSNMKYETFYQYNYSTADYSMGISYRY